MYKIGPVSTLGLLRCPFCGGEPRFENYVIEASVWCDGCGANITSPHSPRKDNGIDRCRRAWNTRPTNQKTEGQR